MNQHDQPADRRRVRAVQRYAVLVRLYPRAHRQMFEKPMLQAFADHLHDAIERAGESEYRFWRDVLADAGRSVAREYLAALQERTAVMHPSRLIALVLGVALLLFDGILLVQHPRVGVQLAMIFAIPVYIAVFFLLARLVRTAPRDAARPTWLRLAVVLGGIVSLYVAAIQLMTAVVPVPTPSAQLPVDVRYGLDQVWLLSLPLLAGVVGIIGGAAWGSEQAGTLLGLVTGGLGLVAWFASQALLIVLLWNALQHHQLQSSLAAAYQMWRQLPGQQDVTLGSFLQWQLFGDGGVFLLILVLVILAVQGVAAAIGASFGAGAFRRASGAAGPEAQPATTAGLARLFRPPLQFTMTILGLGLLTWGLYAGLSLVGGSRFSLSALGETFASPAFLAWLLAGLAVVVAVLVTARPGPLRRERNAPAFGR
ncbi:MAG TPA: hypothetical protein VGR57_19485 [Ktedonobacterales bacterium]|nr:hypothetical protein [Ktedonobacterales bacterium]